MIASNYPRNFFIKIKKVDRNYPPGSKSVALQLGVHLILLYFIRILILGAKTFVFIWMVDGVQVFVSINLMKNLWLYSVGIYI